VYLVVVSAAIEATTRPVSVPDGEMIRVDEFGEPGGKPRPGSYPRTTLAGQLVVAPNARRDALLVTTPTAPQCPGKGHDTALTRP